MSKPFKHYLPIQQYFYDLRNTNLIILQFAILGISQYLKYPKFAAIITKT